MKNPDIARLELMAEAFRRFSNTPEDKQWWGVYLMFSQISLLLRALSPDMWAQLTAKMEEIEREKADAD